jgi:hypothetical protein
MLSMDSFDEYILELIFDFIDDKNLHNFGFCSKRYFNIFRKVFRKRCELLGLSDCQLYETYHLVIICNEIQYRYNKIIKAPYSSNERLLLIVMLFEHMKSRLPVMRKILPQRTFMKIYIKLTELIKDAPLFKIYEADYTDIVSKWL